ncbi:MAG: portal protein, partial [Candidatus Micrarchaeia archaeon]
PATVKVVVDKKGFPIGYCQSFSPYRRMTEQEFRSVLEGKTPLSKDEQVFEDWEVVHFKLGGRQRWDIYGVGILEPARWIWRRLMLLEDAILIYRLTRAPARRVFYVDVGNLPPDQALDYLEKVKAMYRKRKFVDPATGRLDFRYNPLSQDEDFFVPVRGGKRTTEIEVLSGMEYTGIEDLEYFRSKLFAALKIPKAYIGYEGEVTRATLSAEDVRFARTVMRIQREIRLGIRHICNVHLASFGIQPALVDFDVLMQVPSAILELAQVEILKSRAELAEALGNLFPVEWILQNVFHLSDAEIDNLLKALKKAEPEAVAVPPEEVETPGIEPFGVPERRFSPTPIERKVATPKEKRKVLFSQLIGYPFKGNGYKEVLEKLRENRKEFRILKGRVDQISRLLKDISNAVRGR